MSLTLYGGVRSRAIRVLWYAEETGLTIDHQPETPHSDAVRKLNPLGQIPVLTDGDQVITDSVAILRYLSDQSGDLTFAQGTAARQMLDIRLNYLMAELEAPLWLWYRRTIAGPEDQISPTRKDDMRADFARAEKGLLRLMDGAPFVAGDTFTIADIVAGHIGGWADRVGFHAKTDAFADYVARMQARPALIAARER